MKSETPMRIVTRREVIRAVADRWAEQYQNALSKPESTLADQRHPKAILRQLRALDLEEATPAQVEAIIGNDSWTALNCNECGESAETVLRFGHDDYESTTHGLCPKCVHAAFALWETRS